LGRFAPNRRPACQSQLAEQAKNSPPPPRLRRASCLSPDAILRGVSARSRVVGEVGLEPTKAKPADLQSAPFAARDTPPDRAAYLRHRNRLGKCRSVGSLIISAQISQPIPYARCGGVRTRDHRAAVGRAPLWSPRAPRTSERTGKTVHYSAGKGLPQGPPLHRGRAGDRPICRNDVFELDENTMRLDHVALRSLWSTIDVAPACSKRAVAPLPLEEPFRAGCNDPAGPS
jgi:hypothetical protein